MLGVNQNILNYKNMDKKQQTKNVNIWKNEDSLFFNKKKM